MLFLTDNKAILLFLSFFLDEIKYISRLYVIFNKSQHYFIFLENKTASKKVANFKLVPKMILQLISKKFSLLTFQYISLHVGIYF